MLRKQIRKIVKDEVSNIFDSPVTSAINFLKKQLNKSKKIKNDAKNLKKSMSKQGKKVSSQAAQIEKKHNFLYKEAVDLLKGTVYGGIGYAVASMMGDDPDSQQKEQVKRLEKAAKDLEKSNKEAARLIHQNKNN